MMNELNAIITYILESEEDDFNENPSTYHVYYKALVVRDGEIEANNILKQAKKALKGK